MKNTNKPKWSVIVPDKNPEVTTMEAVKAAFKAWRDQANKQKER